MIDDGINVDNDITSFLIECLLWNVPDSIYNNYDTWTERIKQAIIFMHSETQIEEKCNEWVEVSNMLYLFHCGNKWNCKIVNDFMVQLWKYLEF